MNYVTPMINAVKKAGDLALLHFRLNMAVYQKNDQGIVTEVDLASEQLLKHELSALISGAGFFAEESGATLGNEYTWIIDPIDGTRNFQRGLPYFCITVALMHHQEIIAAVTYAPAINDLFYVQKGLGSWLNDKRLSFQSRNWKRDGVLAIISGGCIWQKNRLDLIQDACAFTTNNVRCRVYGAAALDLAYAAAGMVDVVMFENFKWWDVAAGILLIQESGGSTMSYEGLPVEQSSANLIAGNLNICNQIVSTLKYKK